MFHISLYCPQIPPNTGNIIRLCANNGAKLHLIKPLAFEMDEKSCRRAGLDYHELANVMMHDNFDAYLEYVGGTPLYAITKFGKTRYDDMPCHPEDHYLFGSETTGLPQEFLDRHDESKQVYIPMKDESRCLNLSNAAAVISYHAWYQLGFA